MMTSTAMSRSISPGVTLPPSAMPPSGNIGKPDPSPGKPDYGSNVDLSLIKNQLERARKAEARANQAYKALKKEHNDALNQLKEVDKKINEAVAAQSTLQESPLQAYSALQRRTVNKFGLGEISNRQSFGLAAITILLGITAIIGRVE
tara:strand:+ start:76 stop:519 length:444 start_codon:yes stop_codon:yes gene_type:complete